MMEVVDRTPEDARELNVMVSDIRDQYAEALRMLLAPHGFSIHRVRSGLDAIRLAERHVVDAAVIDNDLPDMPGLRALRIIRSLDQSMPIILVGLPSRFGGPAGEQEHLLRAALQLQAFSVLAQPVDLELLLGQMARLFDRFVSALRPPVDPEASPPEPVGPPEPGTPEPESTRRWVLRFRRRR